MSSVSFFRFSLDYKGSSSVINYSRLPNLNDYRSMNIAYREQLYSREELSVKMMANILNILFLCSLFYFIVNIIPTIPIITVLPIAMFFGLSISFSMIIIKRYEPTKIFIYFFFSVLIIFMIYLIGYIIKSNIYFAYLTFSIITFFAFHLYGEKPVSFYFDWILAHPKFSAEEQTSYSKNVKNKFNIKPNITLLAGFLIISILSFFMPSCVILVIVCYCFYKLKKNISIFKFNGEFWQFLGQYFYYNHLSTYAPGVWIHNDSVLKRRIIICSLLVLIEFTFSISLNLYFSWDILYLIKLISGYDLEYITLQKNPFLSWLNLFLVQPTYKNFVFLAFSFSLSIISFIMCIIIPILILATIYLKPIIEARKLKAEIEKETFNNCPEWEWYTNRLRFSLHSAQAPLEGVIRESEHLFLGIEQQAQFPVLLNKKILSEHCYIVGETGSGKTSLGIMPLIIQLLRGGLNEEGKCSPPPAIVILDLKGDSALFNITKTEMEKRRKEFNISDPKNPLYSFLFFTPEKDMTSCFFNPFDSFGKRSDTQLCQLLLDSLSLNHGEGYGRSFFSKKNRDIILAALESKSKPKSFEDLYEVLKKNVTIDSDYSNNAFELLSTIHSLSKYPTLSTNGDEPEEYSIHMPKLIEKSQLAYFWLPSVIESMTVREIAKLALFSLISSAIDRQRRGQEVRQTYLIIDEFQRIAGENFKIILEQARSFGISAILANQTQSDLNTHDVDLRPTIRTNTRTKMYFSMSDPEEVESLVKSSGEEAAIHSATYNLYSTKGPMQIKPRLKSNDIIKVSDHPLNFILNISRGSGYSQYGGVPLIVRTTYPLKTEDYIANSQKDWPEIQGLKKLTKSTKEIDKEVKDEANKQYANNLLSKLHDDENQT